MVVGIFLLLRQVIEPVQLSPTPTLVYVLNGKDLKVSLISITLNINQKMKNKN